MRGRSARWRILKSTLWRRGRLWRETRAAWRSIAALATPRWGLCGSAPGRVSWDAPAFVRRSVPVQQAPCRAVLVPPDRGPGAARARGYEARPQAPHPAPPARRLMMAPSGEWGCRNITIRQHQCQWRSYISVLCHRRRSRSGQSERSFGSRSTFPCSLKYSSPLLKSSFTFLLTTKRCFSSIVT